jgi:xanthine/uracil/vitamin C permease (AzgA family)
MFVVIALSAERRRLDTEDSAAALGSFATPTVVHFCAALLIAAFASTPRQTAASLAGCLLVTGAAGLVYSVMVAARAARQKAYAPVLSDWVWHAGLPLLTYLLLLITALVMRRAPEGALYGVEAAELLLLFIGIHNAWDAAVWIATSAEPPAPPPSSPSGGAPG